MDTITTEIKVIYSMTVQELLELPLFCSEWLVAGKKGVKRFVSGLSLIEMSVGNDRPAPKELLICSCLSTSEDADFINSLIPKAIHRDLSGIFIKISDHFKKIPNFMIRQADSYQLPLIEIPAEIPTASIVKTISDELISRKTSLLQKTISVNKMLTDTIIGGASLDKIAEMISSMINSSVMILDTLNMRRAIHIADSDQAAFSGMEIDDAANTLINKARVHEMYSGGVSFGYLYLYGTELSTYLEPEILSQVLFTVPLEIAREHRTVTALNTELSNYIFHLLSDPIENEEWEAARAASLGIAADDIHTILRFHIRTVDGCSNYTNIIQQTLFLNNLRSLFVNHKFKIRCVQSCEEFIFLLSSSQTDRNDKIFEQYLSDFAAVIPDKYNTLTIAGGCSRPYSGIAGIIRSNHEAVIAQTVASNTGKPVLFFGSLGVLRMIYADNPQQEIENFLSETLGDLMQDDVPRNSELLETLSCYLKYAGNIKKMSEEMFTHYNTVTYRLKKISEITQHSLHDMNSRFELELALNLYNFLKHRI